jgi:hypothetical protein
MIAGHTINVIEHNLAIIEAINATKNLIAALPKLESTESDDDEKLPPLTPYEDDDLTKIIAIYSNDKPKNSLTKFYLEPIECGVGIGFMNWKSDVKIAKEN